MNRSCMALMVLFSCVNILLFACHYPAHWGGRNGWEHGPGMMRWFGPFGMFIFWVLAILVIIGIIWWLMRAGKSSEGPKTGETALDILKRRYAAGEITKEEFEETKRNLER